MKKWMLSFCALLMCALLLLPFAGTANAAIDLSKSVSLTVKTTGDAVMAEDLASVGVSVDAYRIATAEAVSGFDTYKFKADPLFVSLQSEMDDPDMNSDKWNSIAQKAADIILRGKAAKTIKDGDLNSKTGTTDKAIDLGNNPGLYVIMARGSDIKQDKPTNSVYPRYAQVNSAGKLVTIANTQEYKYSFEPVLVALPNKTDEIKEGTTINTADNPDEWVYDPTIYLKPERLHKDGQLRIIKTFERFEIDHTVTSVFKLTAYSTYVGEGSSSNVVVPGFEGKKYSIVSTTEEGGSVTVDGIPYGSTVVVTEVYAGHAYTFVSKVPETPLIIGDEIAEVTFTNTYDDHNRHGGSVTNSFKYDDTADKWNLNGTTNKGNTKSW